MTFFTRTGKQLPKVIVDQAENAKKDEVSRREFLALASTYGATAATAYSLLGMAAPAEAASGKMGGTVRIQQDVRALKDPRTYDWSQIANFTRGWLKTLCPTKMTGHSNRFYWKAGTSVTMQPSTH